MTAVLTFWIAIGLFFTSAPQQLLMTEAGQGGGELIAGAAVQVALTSAMPSARLSAARCSPPSR